MELKINKSTIVKVEGRQAEIISDGKYKLVIFLDKDKVTAKYSDVILTIEFSKFDAEKLARKIFNIVRTTHKFSIVIIQKVLVMLSTDILYIETLKKLKKAKEKGNTELMLKIYELLEKS